MVSRPEAHPVTPPVLTVFAAAWATAALFPAVGNPRISQLHPATTPLGVATALLCLAALWVLAAPIRLGRLAVLAALVPAVAWLEAPILANHWWLAAAVSVAFLVAAAGPVMRRRRLDGEALAERFLPAARWTLIVFYSFAAFAKLNTAFLDPEVSCAVYYFNQSMTAVGLPGVSGPAGTAVILASLIAELSVPVLLAVPATRPAGVLVGLAFHYLVALDLGQHFYDFSAVLFPLFLLFLPSGFAGRLVAGVEEWRRGRPVLARAVAGLLLAGGLVMAAASLVRPFPLQLGLLGRVPFLAWALYGALAVWSVVLLGRPGRPGSLRWRLAPSAWVVVALVVVNGLTPYLEAKTAFGFTMYSNLAMVDGSSNHLVVARSFPVTDAHRRLVEVVETDDPGLDLYRAHGYLLPWVQFRDYLARHPEVAVTYAVEGQPRRVARAGDLPEFTGPDPEWRRRLFPFRAVDARHPTRCQAFWYPAT
ncbi:MAG: hypothetical protein ACRDVM_04490 [Acidimicrobiia bacterium]